jgi:hypothetical protein
MLKNDESHSMGGENDGSNSEHDFTSFISDLLSLATLKNEGYPKL